VGKFLTDPIWYFYLSWLPSFFYARYHLSLLKLGLPLIAVYNIAAIGSIGGGWLPSLFTRWGVSVTRARMLAMLSCACLVVPILAVTRLGSEWGAVALLSLAAGAHQGWSANLMTTASDMFPRRAVGAVTGFGGMAGAVGGALMAAYAGKLLELTHSYVTLFWIAAGAYLLALALMRMIAPGFKPVEAL
jgi:ACS family hexuronate transporter-like MFS transporter